MAFLTERPTICLIQRNLRGLWWSSSKRSSPPIVSLVYIATRISVRQNSSIKLLAQKPIDIFLCNQCSSDGVKSFKFSAFHRIAA
jgi:hypothetical protein